MVGSSIMSVTNSHGFLEHSMNLLESTESLFEEKELFMSPPPSNSNKECRLCRRTTKRGTTEHHLIPRSCHKNKWFKKNYSLEEMNITVSLCRDCHTGVHQLVPSEKELGRKYNSIEKLRSHEEIGKFVVWVSRQK